MRHMSVLTEEAYIGWTRRFIIFHGKRHPDDMADPEVSQFLSALATENRVAASTQNPAARRLTARRWTDVASSELDETRTSDPAVPS